MRWLTFVVAVSLGGGCGSREDLEVEGGPATRGAEGVPADAVQRDTLPNPILDAVTPSQTELNRTIWIEGGTFLMGTDESYPALGPAHEVTVSSFWIQEHEVTNAEFRSFDPTHRSVSGPDRHPVAYVQWQEAMDYAASLGGSLPTEAQWEYGGRGREGRTYPWGEAMPTCALAHYDACEPRGTRPVMSLPAGATPEGVHDLAGNVMEWIFDIYGDYGATPATDPMGPAVGVGPQVGTRVLRGGAWMLDTTYLSGVSRTSWPEMNSPEVVEEMPFIGFRVVWPGNAGPDSPPLSR